MRFLKSVKSRAVATLAGIGAAGVAAASDSSYVDNITGSVDWATVVGGIGVIAAAMAGVYVAIKGARMLLGMIRR